MTDPNEAKQTTVDFLVAQKMMYHIKEYFYLTNRKNKTRKMRIKLTRTTRKKTSE
jgi:low temperature requirement protein LtrA